MKTEKQNKKRREKKALKWVIGNSEFENFMYENQIEDICKQLSPYHFRISPKYKNHIDVWVGVKKFFIKGTGNACTYEKIDELLVFIK